VLIALRFFATGCFLKVTGDVHGVEKSTASNVVHCVSRAIASMARRFIKMPTTPEELEKTKNGFYRIARFPRCLGAIDCTHVKIQSPGGNNAELFRNRKGYFSLNVQVSTIMHLIYKTASVLINPSDKFTINLVVWV